MSCKKAAFLRKKAIFLQIYICKKAASLRKKAAFLQKIYPCKKAAFLQIYIL